MKPVTLWMCAAGRCRPELDRRTCVCRTERNGVITYHDRVPVAMVPERDEAHADRLAHPCRTRGLPRPAGGARMKPLAERLREWGYDQGKRNPEDKPYGWGFCWGVWESAGVNEGKVYAELGPHRGYGWTTNEALNNLADRLVGEGWTDDRDDALAARGEQVEPTSFPLPETPEEVYEIRQRLALLDAQRTREWGEE